MTERVEGAAAGEDGPGFAASSYAADAGLLAELRAAWPLTAPPIPAADAGRGFVRVDLAARRPDAAVRLGDPYGVALIADPDGTFIAVPVARDGVLVTAWRLARPGDGLSAFVAGVPMASERAIEADQTNESVIVGERAIVKWFRRVGPGPSRAATLIAHLDAVGFAEIPAPLGSIAWRSPAGAELTLAQGDAFLPGARDGWDWCVARLERHVAHGETACPADCDPWIGGALGRLVARLHAALATPSGTIVEPVSTAGAVEIGRWRTEARATLDDALRLSAEQDPQAGATLAALEPAMRADLGLLGVDRPIRAQPVHGDLHIGQILEWSGGLAVIDFDGNPAFQGEANAIRQAPERDVAQMLSSLDHVGRVIRAHRPSEAGSVVDDWIARNRREFLDALQTPPKPELLAAFEVEQECRELVYAARFLPRWRYAPLATLWARYGS